MKKQILIDESEFNELIELERKDACQHMLWGLLNYPGNNLSTSYFDKEKGLMKLLLNGEVIATDTLSGCDNIEARIMQNYILRCIKFAINDKELNFLKEFIY